MTKQIKYLKDAYLRSFLGAITGAVGWHRYYLGYPLIGTLQSLLFLGGLLLVVFYFVSVAAQLMDGVLGSLQGGSVDIGVLDKAYASTAEALALRKIGFVCMGAGFVWWFVDLFFIPGLVKKYNADIAQK